MWIYFSHLFLCTYFLTFTLKLVGLQDEEGTLLCATSYYVALRTDYRKLNRPQRTHRHALVVDGRVLSLAKSSDLLRGFR